MALGTNQQKKGATGAALVALACTVSAAVFIWNSRPAVPMAQRSYAVEEGTPMAWCTSGGGWRAMVAGMGFARSLQTAQVLTDPSLKMVSSNSGGTWFLAQFGERKCESIAWESANCRKRVDADACFPNLSPLLLCARTHES